MKPLLLKHSQLQAFGPSRPSKMWLQSFMNLPLMSPIYWLSPLLLPFWNSRFFFNFIVVLGEVHCDIYKGSYNVSNMSYLNSPLHHSPLSPHPHSRNSFNRYLFSVHIHKYTVFALYSPSYTLSLPPPPPTGIKTPTSQVGPVLPSCSPIFWRCKRKEKEMIVLFV
jgi:hypothetical protein